MQSVIEWVKAADRLPMTEEQAKEYFHRKWEYPEYLVFIEGATIPAILYFDGNYFFEIVDESKDFCPVECWAELPKKEDIKP